MTDPVLSEERLAELADEAENCTYADFYFHTDDAIAVIAMARRSLEVEGLDWQPIETAPRDGTWMLLSPFYVQNLPFIGRWMNGVWEDTDEQPLTRFTYPPTHWRPIPAPPSHRKGAAK